MKIFITGGSGFLGTHTVTHFLREGDQVLALARSDGAAQKLKSLGAEVVRGDLGSIQEWENSLRGCDAVVHCAAPVEFWGPWEKFEQDIVHASEQLLLAAAQQGVKRFVHISSESVLQDALPLFDIDETYPYPEHPNSLYGKAKKIAELRLLAAKVPIGVVILRPPFVWGEGCPAFEEISTRVKAGAFTWVDGGKHPFEAVHAANLAHAIFLATRGEGKGVYFVTDDEPITVRAFFTSYLTSQGIKIPRKNMPGVVVKWLAAAVEKLWKFAGLTNPPPLSKFEWAFVGMPRRYKVHKIKNDLGYQPVISREQGFRLLIS